MAAELHGVDPRQEVSHHGFLPPTGQARRGHAHQRTVRRGNDGLKYDTTTSDYYYYTVPIPLLLLLLLLVVVVVVVQMLISEPFFRRMMASSMILLHLTTTLSGSVV